LGEAEKLGRRELSSPAAKTDTGTEISKRKTISTETRGSAVSATESSATKTKGAPGSATSAKAVPATTAFSRLALATPGDLNTRTSMKTVTRVCRI